MKVAIVHDWLVTYGGAERWLGQVLDMYPNADLFCVCDFLSDGERGFLKGRRARTTFIQRLPFARRRYRSYLPLMPLAVEQLDLSGYDVVISSSHAVAKGVITGPDQLHISYVHSPMRYAWDLQHQYLREAGLDHGVRSWLARWMLHRLRLWDVRTANGVDVFVANSAYIARRIEKCYRRKAIVLYSGIELDWFSVRAAKDAFYFTASRMVPYKRMDVIVDAFCAMPARQLIVIGDGPQFANVRARAEGHPNIRLMGYQSAEVLRDHMQRARAFVFAAEEDFGRVPVEAQACGTPVIAFGKGGALETVRPIGTPRPTGLFFDRQAPEAIVAAVDRFEHAGNAIDPIDCRANAERFSLERFREHLSALVQREWDAFQDRMKRPLDAVAPTRQKHKVQERAR